MHFVRAPNGGRRSLRQSQIAHFSGFYQLRHGTHGFLDRHIRVDAVLIVQVDRGHAQALQTRFATSPHVFRAAINPTDRGVRLVAYNPEFGREKSFLAQAANRLPDQHFVVAVAVNVRSIQKGDTELNGTMNCGCRFRIMP